MLGWTTSKLGLTRLTTARTWGSHHLPFYSILYGWPWDQHPNGNLSQDPQVEVLKFPQLGLPQLWGPITLGTNIWLIWGLKQSSSPCTKISNGMLHATFTRGDWGDSRLLVVGSQINDLTLDLSFGHNLCFKCPNASFEPIS
jgi:hypothetical protein